MILYTRSIHCIEFVYHMIRPSPGSTQLNNVVVLDLVYLLLGPLIK